MLFIKCCFLVSLGAISVGIKSFGFPEGAHNRGIPSNLTIYTKSPFGWRSASGVVGGSFFLLPHDLFHSTLLYIIYFSLPITVCFKNGTFLLHLSRELHVEIRFEKKKVFLLNVCGTQTQTKLVQMIFNASFGYSEYGSYLRHHTARLFSINVLIWVLSTSTGLPKHGPSSSEKSPAWNFARHFWHVGSVTAPFQYNAQIFFRVSVAFLHFLK